MARRHTLDLETGVRPLPEEPDAACDLDHPCDQHSHCNHCGNGLASEQEDYLKLCSRHQEQA